MIIDNTQDKLNYILDRGFDIAIGKNESGVFLELIKDHKTLTQEDDINLFNVVDKTYQVLVGGGYN